LAFTIRQTAQGAQFAVRVQPRASRCALAGLYAAPQGDALKVAITAPPVEGKANEAVVEFLAGVLGVAKSSVTIVTGETGRNKVVSVCGLAPDEVRRRLGL
jgi:uncharacterized protein (TIGR00251 family)